jgi:hypothetical protein
MSVNNITRSRAHKNRGTAENFGVNRNQRVWRHAASITDSGVRVTFGSFSENKVRRGETPRPTLETRALPRHRSAPDIARRPQDYVFGDVDEFRLPAKPALRVTLNVIYPAAPAQSRVHRNAHHTF